MDIVYLSNNFWNSIRQRPQQMALALSKYGRVLFVEPPTYYWIKRKKKALLHDETITEVIKDRLFVLSPIGTPPGKNLFGSLNKYYQRKTAQRVIAFCEKLSFNSPLVWCTFPNQVPALELWKDATVVYECMDEYALLESSIGKKLFESYESELLAKAELTVFTADNLVKTKSGGCRNHILSNNAVDHAFFSRVLYDETLDGVKVFENMNPVVGYVGAVREWMDLPLLRSVIAALPGINFLFIGPVGTNVSSLLNYKNVQFTGAVNYTQLPAYLKYIDVTMVPFQNNDIIGNTNPIKIYEYLAAGKPVVTTYFEETKRFGEFVSVIRSSYEMTSAITDLITSDNAELRKRRSEFAAQHTWERRAQEILSKLTGIPKIHMNK